MSQSIEHKLERVAGQAAQAQVYLDEAIRAAWTQGLSLRKIAIHAGVSHEQVRRIVART